MTYNKSMHKIKENKGRISFIEIIVIIALVLEAIYLLAGGFNWSWDKWSNGDDKLYVNTAESTANANSLNGIHCPVSDCGSSDVCEHFNGEYYVGYFNSVTHKIDGYPMKGYNQNKTMTIDDKTYYGDVGTMIIQIKCKEGSVILDWVKGD